MDAAGRLLGAARRLADAYRRNTDVAAVLAAGSTGTGVADSWYLDLVVFWRRPPTDTEREAPIVACGGVLEDLAPFEEDEWAEGFVVDGFKVGTSQFLVSTMDRYLDRLVEEASPDDNAQILVAAVQSGTVLYGEPFVARWRERAASYPEALARAVVADALGWRGGWGSAAMLAERDDLVALVGLLDDATRAVLRALLALNRLYLPNPRLKWWRSLVQRLAIAPRDPRSSPGVRARA
jgi:hypothetical protein